MMRIFHLMSLISSMLMTIPILVLSTWGSDLTTGVSADHGNDIQLTAYLEPGDALHRSPSCVHTFASLLMVNTHAKETITIISMETVPSIDGDNVEIHTSHFANRVVEIKPKESTMIPIKFFPQIPSYYSDCNQNRSTGVLIPATADTDSGDPWHYCLSMVAAADFADLGGNALMGGTMTSDLEDGEHAVQATVLIHTSRGTFKHKISASASKQNPYRVPHSILFHSDGFVSSSDLNYAGRESAYGHRLEANITDDKAYEFDLYMDNNNMAEELRVSEVFTSRDDLFEIKYFHLGGYRGNNLAYFRYNNCGPVASDIRHCNQPKAHELRGPIFIPTDGKRSYIATIKLNKNAIDSLPDTTQTQGRTFLAYLQIITSRDDLSIVLEFERHKHHEHISSPKLAAKLLRANVNATKHLAPLDADTIHDSGRYPLRDVRHSCDFMNGRKTGSKTHHKPTNSNILYGEKPTPTLAVSSSLSFIDFGVLTSTSDKKVQDISITNHGTVPLHLMRAKITTDFGPQYSHQNQGAHSRKADDFRLAVKAVIAIAEDEDSRVIQPGATVDEIVTLSIFPNTDVPISESDLPLVYHGSAIIHAGRVDQSYYDWKQMVVNDPASASSYIVEIAFTVRVIYGHIEFDIEDVYFPAKKENLGNKKAVSESSRREKQLCDDSFDRTLHFTNSFPAPLQLKRIRVQGETGSNLSFLPPDFCSEHFRIVQFGDGGDNSNRTSDEVANFGQSWGGITLRYTYYTDAEHDFFRDSKRCTLSLETDLAGEFDIPLWIFSGLVHVRPERTVIPPQCRTTSGSGLGCLESTFNRLGRSTFSRLTNSNDNQKKHKEDNSNWQKGWMRVASKELLSMGRAHEDVDDLTTYLEPIVLSVGSLASESIKTYSIFITNHNPTTISMTALIPSVEGTEIRLGRTVASVIDYMQGAKADAPAGKVSSPPDDRAKDWLKTYLSAANLSQNIFGPLRYRDDIYLSRTATDEIKQLYHRNAIIKMHQNSHDSDETVMARHGNGINLEKFVLEMHPPGFTNATISTIHTSVNKGSSMFSVPTVSTKDGIFASKLLRGHNKSNAPTTWLIPPGGVVRLEVSVRPPPESALLGREYVDFFSTGVVLETNFGQRLPIIVEYRALAGQVYMDTDVAVSETLKVDGAVNWLNTPAIIRPNDILKKTYMEYGRNDEQGTQVVIKNTFPKGAILKKVYSCNNWFRILWNHSSTKDGLEPIPASVHSSIFCPSSSKSKSAATFFDCALAWIEQRHQIQQGRCGMKEEEFTNINSIVTEQDLFSENQIEALQSKLILQLKNMISYLDRRYQEGSKMIPFEGNRSIPVFPGQEISDDFLNKLVAKQIGTLKDHVSSQNVGIIPISVLDMFDEVLVGWKAISSLGLNVVTGNVRADIEIQTETNSNKDSTGATTNGPLKISIPLASPSLQSTLEIPRIFYPRDGFAGSTTDGENNIQFNTTPIAQVAQLYIPVRNPSGTPIRVRLATMLFHKRNSPPAKSGTFYTSVDSDFFVQTTAKELNPWWTGGSYYLADQKGTMMGSTHNVTLKAGKGASLKLSNPSLHSSVAFVQGCVGRRCGYPVPKDPKKTTSPQAYVSSIGASAATGETLRGRYYNRDGGENELSSSAERNIEESQPFALGLKSLQEITIPPFGVGQIGPVFFRPPSRKTFTGLLFLENNLTGLENIIVEGKGGWEKVVFFDSLAMGMNGDDLESRYGKPTLIFSGADDNVSIVKSVVVANVGDTEVKFEYAHLSEASISRSNLHQSKFSHQRPHQSTSLLGTSRCNKRGFTLLGCYDDITVTKEEDASGVTLSIIHKIMKYLSMLIPDSVPTRGTNDQSNTTNILDGFSLLPNETKVLHISHTPDSTFSSMYIALNLEVERVDDRSQRLNPQDLQSTTQHGLFQDKTLQLLLGYDLRSSETRRSAQPKQSLHGKLENPDGIYQGNSSYVESETLKPFIQRTLGMLISLVPLLMLFLILIDMFSGSRQRYAASRSFEACLSPSNGSLQTRELISSRRNATDNWICAYRCLSRAEPSFSDLQHIGREQTRQMVLGRYRKNSVLHPQCILANGTFVRERHSSGGHSDGNEIKGGSTVKDEHSALPLRRNAGPMTVIFCRCRDLNASILSCDICCNPKIPATPCGLYWREAARRGIIPNPTGNSSILEQQSASTNLCRTPSPTKIVNKEELPQKLVAVIAVKKTSLHDASTLSTSRLHNENYENHKVNENYENHKVNGHTIKPSTTDIERDHLLSKLEENKMLSQGKIIQVFEKSKGLVRQNGKPKINTKITKQSKVIGTPGYGKNPPRAKTDSSSTEKKALLVKGIEKQTDTMPLLTRRQLFVGNSTIRNQVNDAPVPSLRKLSFRSIVVSPQPAKVRTTIVPKIKQIIQKSDVKEKSAITADDSLLENCIDEEVASVESEEVAVNAVESPSLKAVPEAVPANSLSPLSVQDRCPLKDLEINIESSLSSTKIETASEKNGSQNILPFPLEPDLISQQSSTDGRSTLNVSGEECASHELPIRPPPGLSPPPGFPSPMSEKRRARKVSSDCRSMLSDLVSPATMPPKDVLGRSLFEAAIIDSSSKLGGEELNNTTEKYPPLPPELDPLFMEKGDGISNPSKLIENEHDFNVMNFLEFLEDDAANNEKEKIDDTDDTLGLSATGKSNMNSLLRYSTVSSNSLPSIIRSNPWGSEPETSRALAYGIEVEGESENDVQQHLGTGRMFTDGDIEEDSFFSNLLKGD